MLSGPLYGQEGEFVGFPIRPPTVAKAVDDKHETKIGATQKAALLISSAAQDNSYGQAMRCLSEANRGLPDKR